MMAGTQFGQPTVSCNGTFLRGYFAPSMDPPGWPRCAVAGWLGGEGLDSESVESVCIM